MFGALLTLVITLMQVYVFWRGASVPFVRRHLAAKYLIGLGLFLWALFLASRLLDHTELGVLAAPLEFAGMTWFGTLFLLFVTLLAVDVATGFGWFTRRAPALRGMALATGGMLAIVALIQGMRPPVMQDYDVYLARLPGALDGTVVVVLSDLHLGPVLGAPWLSARVAQVQAAKPAVIVLLGDVFEGHSAPGPELVADLRRLSAPLGVWGVLGNHEFHSNNNGNAGVFAAAGIHILRNSWTELRPGLVLAGVEDLTYNNDTATTSAALARALAGRPPGATILLSHAPLAPNLVSGTGVGLMLSGHTHGGQIWPFGYLVQQRFPLLAGRYEFAGMTAIVSRGTGAWGPRMRLWRPAEILRITLHRGKE